MVLYRYIQISEYLNSILNTAVVSTVWPLHGWWNGKAFVKNIYSEQSTFYCHVMLGSIIKWLRQSIKQGRLHVILHFAPLFKCNWSTLQIILEWTENGWSCMRCAFPFYQLVSLPSMLTGIKWTAEQNMWSKNVYFIHAHHWVTLIPVFMNSSQIRDSLCSYIVVLHQSLFLVLSPKTKAWQLFHNVHVLSWKCVVCFTSLSVFLSDSLNVWCKIYLLYDRLLLHWNCPVLPSGIF